MAEFTLLLGADRGNPMDTFAEATALIQARVGPVRCSSRDHWTEPWGFRGDHLFLNRALLVESDLEPGEVMLRLLQIERELGRERPAKGGYAPRTIDIDVLFVGDRTIQEPGLTVPHPRVHERAFALAPAADIVPGLVHPTLNTTVLALLDRVQAE